MDKSQSILELNDDCLLTIFSYLNVRELMTIEKVCERFKSLAEMVCKTQQCLLFDEVERDQRFTVEEVQDILTRPVSQLNTLKASDRAFSHPIESLRNILSNCDNLRKLHLDGFRIRKPELQLLSKTFANLKVAHLRNCGLNDDIMEKCLQEATQLETLNLPLNFNIQGQWLTELQNIQEIDINGCSEIKQSYFEQFLKCNRGLKRLNANFCDLMYSSCLDLIATLENLECLHIRITFKCNLSAFHFLADLPCLRHLKINYCTDFDIDPLLEKLAKRNVLETLDVSNGMWMPEKQQFSHLSSFSRLKVLKLHRWFSLTDDILSRLSSENPLQELHTEICPNITQNGLLTVIKNCPELKILNIYRCNGVTDDLIARVLPILQERTTTLEIVVDKMQQASFMRKHINNSKLKIIDLRLQIF